MENHREHRQETDPAPDRAKAGWESPRRIQVLVLALLTALGLYLCYRLLLPFLSALTWALTLAVIFMPVHRWLVSKVKRATLAALLTVLGAGLIVAVPATFLGQRLLLESARGAELIKGKVESGEWRRAIEAQPRLAPVAGWIERQVDLPGSVRSLATWLTATAGNLVKGSLVQLVGFCLTFYLLFYCLRDRRLALDALGSLSPLMRSDLDRLLLRVEDTVFATVYGTLVVAAVQGLLGGLMFWWLGLPAPLLWGLVMGLLAVVPVLGAFVIWVPAALFLALEGSWGRALVLTGWGALVVGGIDNLLLPVLVGNRLKLHTILAFLAVIGGLMVFGTSGLILGPVILTVTTVLLEIWREQAIDPSGADSPAPPPRTADPGASS